MGTSTGLSGGSGGAWMGYKRSATLFARHGGSDRAAKALAGFVAAMGGAAAAATGAAAGASTAQNLGAFLAGSTGATGMAGGLRALGLERLVGADRLTILTTLVDEWSGSGNDLEAQAARNALLDVLDGLLPADEDADLEAVRLDEAALVDALCRYIAALIYNRAIPVIDQALTRLANPAVAAQRDTELRDFIDALVRLRMSQVSPMDLDWHGDAGRTFVDDILRAVYGQVEALA